MKTKFQDIAVPKHHAIDMVCSSGGVQDYVFITEKEKTVGMYLDTGFPQLTFHGSTTALAFSDEAVELFTGGRKKILFWRVQPASKSSFRNISDS